MILTNLLLLTAIAMVETGGRDGFTGQAGEVSRWQIAPATWRQHSKNPLTHAPAVAVKVALRHLAWILENLPEEKRTPEWVAAVWNAGLGRVRRADYRMDWLPSGVPDYARRVVTCYSPAPSYEFAGAREAIACQLRARPSRNRPGTEGKP